MSAILERYRGEPSFLERVPGLGGLFERRRAEQEKWENGSRVVEDAGGKGLLFRLAENLDGRVYESKRGSLPYVLVLYWDLTADESMPAPKGVMLVVLEEGVKVAYSDGFDFWKLLENSNRHEEYLRVNNLREVSLEAQVDFAKGCATSNFHQELNRVRVEEKVVGVQRISLFG